MSSYYVSIFYHVSIISVKIALDEPTKHLRECQPLSLVCFLSEREQSSCLYIPIQSLTRRICPVHEEYESPLIKAPRRKFSVSEGTDAS